VARTFEVPSIAALCRAILASTFCLSLAVSAELTGTIPTPSAAAIAIQKPTIRTWVRRRPRRDTLNSWLIVSLVPQALWLSRDIRPAIKGVSTCFKYVSNDTKDAMKRRDRCPVTKRTSKKGRECQGTKSAPERGGTRQCCNTLSHRWLYPQIPTECEPSREHRQPRSCPDEPGRHHEQVRRPDEVDRQPRAQIADAIPHHRPQDADRQRGAHQRRDQGLKNEGELDVERGGTDQSHDPGLSPTAECRLTDGRGDQQDRAQHHQRCQAQSAERKTPQHVEQRVQDPLLVLDVAHPGRTDESAGDHVELRRVRQLHPEALGHLGRGDLTVGGAVLVLRLETVVCLLLGLGKNALDQRLHRIKLSANLVALGAGNSPGGTVGQVRLVCAQEDRDLDPVVPVVLHRVDLPLSQDPQPEKQHRHHGDERDRDRHRQVPAQGYPDLTEDELQAHGSLPVPSSAVSLACRG